MLPPGHAAAGYLVARAILPVIAPHLPASEADALFAWSAFFGMAPDLDLLAGFFGMDPLGRREGGRDHRLYPTHAPIIWLVAGVFCAAVIPAAFGKLFGILLWLCSWSHFVLDSLEDGVMWLWPFSKKRFVLKKSTRALRSRKNIWGYSLDYARYYAREKWLSFSVACAIIVAFLVVFF